MKLSAIGFLFSFFLLISSFEPLTAQLSHTEWRLVQCAINNQLRVVNHRVFIKFNENGTTFTANDGCKDLRGNFRTISKKVEFTNLKQLTSKKCTEKFKSQVAGKFGTTIKSHSNFAIKEDYLIFYSQGIAQLVFAKVNDSGVEETVLRRSARVESDYEIKGKKHYLKVYDYVDNSYFLTEKIDGFSYTPGYTYEIHLMITIAGSKQSGKRKYALIKLISKEKD